MPPARPQSTSPTSPVQRRGPRSVTVPAAWQAGRTCAHGSGGAGSTHAWPTPSTPAENHLAVSVRSAALWADDVPSPPGFGPPIAAIGDIVRMPEMAHTLCGVADHGPDARLRGPGGRGHRGGQVADRARSSVQPPARCGLPAGTSPSSSFTAYPKELPRWKSSCSLRDRLTLRQRLIGPGSAWPAPSSTLNRAYGQRPVRWKSPGTPSCGAQARPSSAAAKVAAVFGHALIGASDPRLDGYAGGL